MQVCLKTPWQDVRNEMIHQKGLAPDVADKIWSYVQMHGKAFSWFIASVDYCFFSNVLGSTELIAKLQTDAQLTAQKSAIEALKDMETLFRYLTLYDVMDKVRKIDKETSKELLLVLLDCV